MRLGGCRSRGSDTCPMGQLVAVFAFGAIALLFEAPAAAINLPQGFQESIVFSGLNNPTAVRFAVNGRVFVAEKSGIIKVYDSLTDTTPDVFADLRTNVHNFWDRGLLGLALHPDFPTTPYVYVLYTYDHILGDPDPAPQWGTVGATTDGCPTPPGATALNGGCLVSGRVSRLEASGNIMIGSENVLIEDWCQQYPSHSIGSLAFGQDGYLYVTGGDGASFGFADYGQGGGSHPDVPLNPCGDPPTGIGGTQTSPTGEGGALRSQDLRTPADPVTLDGALLRIDPITGEGAPGNPLAGSSDLNARRIIGHGMRNPFRMNTRPGTSEIWLGDVGWSAWEELNRIQNPGLLAAPINLGWPCYEGGISGGVPTNLVQGGYSALNVCTALYAAGATAAAPPYTAYLHSQQSYNQHLFVINPDPGNDNNCTTGGSAISGVAFYTGGNYPPQYQGAVFYSDYNRRCITVMFPAGSGDPDQANRWKFATKAGSSGPVELQIGPGGDLFYVDLGGAVRRIRYLSPDAKALADPLTGAAPLLVDFDGSGSTPGGNPLAAWDWDLDGDGQYDDATGATPSFTYDDPGSYTVRLRVTDSAGGFDISDPLTIVVSNTPPLPEITTPAACPAPSPCWEVGDTIGFSGSATDPQEGALPSSALTWALVQFHCPSNCHEHTVQEFPGVAAGSFVAPDHEFPSFLQLRLTATDSLGLPNTVSVDLHPRTVALTLETSPAGLDLTFFSETAAAPLARTVIIGSSNSVTAPSPQTLGGVPYAFLDWSDGGAQSHQITAPSLPTTYTATYVSSDLSLTLTDSPDPVCEGGTLSYTVVVSNAGPTTAANVSVSVTLPAGTAAVSAGGTGWSCSGTDVVTCTRSDLPVGPAPLIVVDLTVPVGASTLAASASVTASAPDGAPSNNSGSTSTTVNPIPAPPVASNNGPVCEGGTIGLSASSVVGATYSWTGPGGFTSSDQNPTIANGSPEMAGTYSVHVGVGGCLSPPAPTTVTVHAAPASQIAAASAVCPASAGHVASVLDAGTGSTYWWTVVGGTITGGTGTPAITFSSLTGGPVMLQVVVRNADGCEATGLRTVGLQACPGPAIVSITESSGPAAGGSPFAIDGTGFDSGATVSIGGQPASATVAGATQITGSTPPLAPGILHDVVVSNPGTLTSTLSLGYLADFLDVPAAHLFHDFVESLVRQGVTAGCGGGEYCPDLSVTRAQMSVFLLRAKYGTGYVPPPATGTVFLDVPSDAFAAAWIERLAGFGVAAGCGGGNFCPEEAVTREQMAVLLLRTLEGPLYSPPDCTTPAFGDVPCASPFAAWIQELALRGITAGCGGGNYCPGDAASRGQMAVFLTETFDIP